jgi:hypothetical protein
MILDMTLSIQDIQERLVDSQLYHEALEEFSNMYKCELADQAPIRALKGSTSQRDSVRMSMSMLQDSDQRQVPESQAVERFLRRLGVPPGPGIKSTEQENPMNSLHEKRRHMAELLCNLGTAADSPLAAELDPMHQATGLLNHALHSDSDYRLSLVDALQTEEITSLEEKLGIIQKGAEGLNLDILHQRDKAHEKFIERWQQ